MAATFLRVLVELDAVDDDGAFVVLLQPVDAADQRRLARARWPAHDNPLTLADRQVDVLQNMKLAEPLVDAAHFDDRRVPVRGNFGH